jgi:hypothetical protein
VNELPRIADVYVAALLCQRIEELPENRQTLHGVGMAPSFMRAKGELVRFEAELYFTLFFTIGRGAPHAGRLLLRDRSGEIVHWSEFEAMERAGKLEVNPRSLTVAHDLPRALFFLCLEIDGADRWVTPIDTRACRG